MYKVGIITASDKGSRGERIDESGQLIREMMEASNYQIADYIILPDERIQLSQAMKKIANHGEIQLILTTGGTGLSPRDWTPEATLDIADRQVPGIAEAMRAYSMTKTDRAMLSRGVAVICQKTLIINLPGSKKAVKENLECILPTLDHALGILTGDSTECGNQNSHTTK